MQFKYPDLLWALFLLLIPIFIHLFQLRRFKKTPFTNVRALQKVVSESHRSNTVKKWLLLLTRLSLLAALIIAFAQPFFAEKLALKKKETVIYLDDSFSMQAKTNKMTLLEHGVQELLKELRPNDRFTLFTNEKVFEGITAKDIRNELLTLKTTSKQLKLDEIYLKAHSLFDDFDDTEKELILISDFQVRMASPKMDSSDVIRKHLVQLVPDGPENIAIDSVYLETAGLANMELTAILSSNLEIENAPVSLFNDEKLIAKTSATFNKNKVALVSFTIPEGQTIKGRLEISDTGLAYDNRLYFSIDKKEKIKVMAIGSADSDYLQRIFSEDEFQFSNYALKDLNYGSLEAQHLIVLNELETIPSSLSTSLRSFTENGGSLVVIPSRDIDFISYNTLLAGQHSISYTQKVEAESNITNISFSHPLFQDVFEKKVSNFQYPKTLQYFRIKTAVPTILSLQDGAPFLVGTENLYAFTASIASNNSNFKSSPLIVPTLYNMGRYSLKLPQLYQTIGNASEVEVSFQLPKDHILKLSQKDHEFIPQQRSLANKVVLSFQENDLVAGVYEISDQGTPLKNISFNYLREESELRFLELAKLNSASVQRSVATLFQNMRNDNAMTKLWKWFVILAVLFVMMEVLIQKYYK